jgi:hypothetical protein
MTPALHNKTDSTEPIPSFLFLPRIHLVFFVVTIKQLGNAFMIFFR